MHQQDTFPSKMFDIIQKIANLSFDGNYLFRGEPKYHCKISSTLYRECKGIFQKAGLESELSDFDIEAIEEEILKQVKEFIPSSEHKPLSILTQLQHYESQTNLIDFTTDFHIALFFACDNQPDQDGRVIILQKNSVKTEQPLGVEHRVLAQKSVFVRPKRGYIDPNKAKYKVVKIPAYLKENILRYLRNGHGITTETIYNDLHGYIRNKNIHQSAYGEFHIAFAYQNKAKKTEDIEEKDKLRGKAIEHYTEAIKYNPNFRSAYENRKTLYSERRENYEAVQDSFRVFEDFPNLIRESEVFYGSDGQWMEIQDPISVLNRILEESYDYLEYDERNSEGIVKLRVKVKETSLDAERNSNVMYLIKRDLERETGRYYVPILNPVSGSPSDETRETKWRYFTLYEMDRPRRMENE